MSDKWEETKLFLKNLPRDYKTLIEEQMKKNPSSIKVIRDIERGKFYEWYFLHNGFECFVQFQEFKNNKEDFVRYMAFNDEKNVCFVRKPLEEELL